MGRKKKFVKWLLLFSVLLVCSVVYVCVISVDYKKSLSPKKLTDNNLKYISAGEYVEVDYECIYNAFYKGGVAYGKALEYKILKLYNRDAYIFVSAFVEQDDYYMDKPYYFQSLYDASSYKVGQKYTFLGKIYDMDEKLQTGLEESITMTRPEGPRPMTPANTNLKREIRFADPAEKKDRQNMWIAISIAIAILWVYSLMKLVSEISAEKALKKKEERERAEALAIEKRSRYSSVVNSDDDNTWK